MSARMGKLRQDIQALRGFAVVAVVFYHSAQTWFPLGYLGVDIFLLFQDLLLHH